MSTMSTACIERAARVPFVFQTTSYIRILYLKVLLRRQMLCEVLVETVPTACIQMEGRNHYLKVLLWRLLVPGQTDQ